MDWNESHQYIIIKVIWLQGQFAQQIKFVLQGYVLGNPLTFPYEDNYKIRFNNGMGLVSDKLYKVCSAPMSHLSVDITTFFSN